MLGALGSDVNLGGIRDVEFGVLGEEQENTDNGTLSVHASLYALTRAVCSIVETQETCVLFNRVQIAPRVLCWGSSSVVRTECISEAQWEALVYIRRYPVIFASRLAIS